MNDTTRPGYLTAVGIKPIYDEPLEQQLAQWIHGISGLPESDVIIDYANPPFILPPVTTDWCGFSIDHFFFEPDIACVPVNADSDYHWQFESLAVICRFYGPHSQTYANAFRSGVFVSQNNAELNLIGFSLGDVGNIVATPELINNQWQRRYDLPVTLRRKAIREYGIKSFLSTSVQISGE
ncbi:hypothetical protein NLZ15_12665 [Atlantibacter subterranea]|uniref:phage neck terminator protein n=1 Tax=Atlantibacter subterraneus TaxID=255519 RepID=UPI0020C1BC3D|nr:hypothetical protein [Atlantibacter subterranea]UTJ45713.1 hypothetical protein NLZ15_12665 [Atlantibacter subterranea]